jgi:hypothetical protein
MALTCPECGAKWSAETTCQSIFDSFLVLEFTDPAYGAVHFLTVSCFMVQHGRYSDEALSWIQATLKAYFEEKMTPSQLRQLQQRAARGVGGEVRTWKMARHRDAPPAPHPLWSMTIMDVAQQYHDAPSYCNLVRQWARLTSKELGEVLKR